MPLSRSAMRPWKGSPPRPLRRSCSRRGCAMSGCGARARSSPDQPRIVGQRLHAALRSGARGSRDARVLVVAHVHPRGDRGDPAGRGRGRRRDGRDRCRHLRRHPLRAHGEAAGRRAGHRRRRARCRRRQRHRAARLVPGRRRAAFGGRPDLRRLAGADRLRRRRGDAGRRRRRSTTMAPSSFRRPWWTMCWPRHPSRSAWRSGS